MPDITANSSAEMYNSLSPTIYDQMLLKRTVDFAPVSASVESSITTSPAIAITVTSQKLDVVSPITIASFEPEISNVALAMKSTPVSPSIGVIERRDKKSLTKNVLSIVDESSSSVDENASGSTIETIDAVPVADNATLLSESMGRYIRCSTERTHALVGRFYF